MKKDIKCFLLKAYEISKVGLLYSNDPYAIENYTNLQNLCDSFLKEKDVDLGDANFFKREIYPTPSISVRAVVLSEDKSQVLLVKEKKDGGYSLPGGWAEIGLTPSDSCLKELKEEAGIEGKIIRLLGVIDKTKGMDFGQEFSEYTIYFLCGVLKSGFPLCHEIESSGYFDIASLPELSKKNVKEDILRVLQACQNGQTIYD